jgi:hypothetical protein
MKNDFADTQFADMDDTLDFSMSHRYQKAAHTAVKAAADDYRPHMLRHAEPAYAPGVIQYYSKPRRFTFRVAIGFGLFAGVLIGVAKRWL